MVTKNEAKNGAGRIRTGDPLLAKQVLCQLSYDPMKGKDMMYIKELDS